MLIDVHAHLDFPQFDRDRDSVVRNAKDNEIFIINSGIGRDGIEKTMKLVSEYDNVKATLGLSPTEFNTQIIEETIDLIRKYRDRIVGIGEVGLDYYWVKDSEKRRTELENFRRFIDLAEELDLPLVIHSRDAEGDVINELKRKNLPALLHCFGGTLKQAEDAISFGCLISIPTNVVYSKQKQLLSKEIPLESMVLETDSPYLAPVPKTRNEPVNVRLSAEKIAEIRGIELSAVEDITTNNARSFFNQRLAGNPTL